MAKTKANSKKTAAQSTGKEKSGQKPSAEKAAKKALARAEESVQAAQDAVRDSRKKLRQKAEALSEQAKALAAKHEKAQRKVEKAEKKVAAESAAAEQKPKVAAPYAGSGVDTSLLTPPLPSPQSAAPTLIHLRQEAKAKGIAGYSRLNKAALIEALDSAK